MRYISTSKKDSNGEHCLVALHAMKSIYFFIWKIYYTHKRVGIGTEWKTKFDKVQRFTITLQFYRNYGRMQKKKVLFEPVKRWSASQRFKITFMNCFFSYYIK